MEGRVSMQKQQEKIEYNRILPEDDQMMNTAERLWNFSQKYDIPFDESFKILLISKLDNLDKTINNCTIEIATAFGRIT